MRSCMCHRLASNKLSSMKEVMQHVTLLRTSRAGMIRSRTATMRRTTFDPKRRRCHEATSTPYLMSRYCPKTTSHAPVITVKLHLHSTTERHSWWPFVVQKFVNTRVQSKMLRLLPVKPCCIGVSFYQKLRCVSQIRTLWAKSMFDQKSKNRSRSRMCSPRRNCFNCFAQPNRNPRPHLHIDQIIRIVESDPALLRRILFLSWSHRKRPKQQGPEDGLCYSQKQSPISGPFSCVNSPPNASPLDFFASQTESSVNICNNTPSHSSPEQPTSACRQTTMTSSLCSKIKTIRSTLVSVCVTSSYTKSSQRLLPALDRILSTDRFSVRHVENKLNPPSPYVKNRFQASRSTSKVPPRCLSPRVTITLAPLLEFLIISSALLCCVCGIPIGSSLECIHSKDGLYHSTHIQSPYFRRTHTSK